MQDIRFTRPRFDPRVAVKSHECDDRITTTADLAEDSRDAGFGSTPQAAVRAALRAL